MNLEKNLDTQIMSDNIPMEAEQQYPPAMQTVPVQSTEQNKEEPHGQMQPEDTKHLDEEVARLKAVLGSTGATVPQTDEEKRDIDSRSIYVGNVDYGASPAELQQHFASAGMVHRVTILTNKFTGQPKGFAYLEFVDVDSVNKAVATLDGSVFRDRELKVSAKRTNIPGISTTNRGGRGGRGRGRGGFRSRGGRGRGGFRGGSRFTPY